MPYLAGAPPPHDDLGYISATSRPHLGHISTTSRPCLAVHVRRERTPLGCKRGEPSVLCPKPGPKFTINTSAVAARIARESARHGVSRVYISTVYPAHLPKYRRELDMLLASVPGALSLSNASSMARALGCA